MDIKKLKNIKPAYLAVVLLAGVLIMMLSGLGNVKSKDEKTNEISKSSIMYNSDAEKKLGELIGGIDGVSDVSVFVTYENRGVKKILTVGEESTLSGEEKNNSSKRREAVMSKQGTGEEPFVNEEILPEVRGIIISARGLKSKELTAQVTDAVAAAMGVPLHRVKVISKD